MAHVKVPIEQLDDGRFPPVCVKTGRPAHTYVRWHFRHVPGWTFILIFFGILPFLIARVFTVVRFSGRLPLTREAFDRIQNLMRFCWAMGLGGTGLALLSLVAGSASAAMAIAVGTVVAVFIGMVALEFAEPRAKLLDHRWAELGGVHDAFADAVRRERAASG